MISVMVKVDRGLALMKRVGGSQIRATWRAHKIVSYDEEGASGPRKICFLSHHPLFSPKP